MALERVTVRLGVPADPADPCPATIHDLRTKRIRYQYLSPEQLAQMATMRTRDWHAEFVDNRWWLKRPLLCEAAE